MGSLDVWIKLGVTSSVIAFLGYMHCFACAKLNINPPDWQKEVAMGALIIGALAAVVFFVIGLWNAE